MECSNCEQVRKDFLCASCISKELREHQTALTHLSSERDLLVAKASASLTQLGARRGRRADFAALRSRLDDIQLHTRQLREDSDATRERMSARRAALATRRQVLEEAYRLSSERSASPPRTPTPTPPGGPPRRKLPTPSRNVYDTTSARIAELEASLHTLQDSLSRARQGLVQELVDVFAVVEVGGRPAAGVRAATRGAWSIGGLVLPVPGDMRRVPPAHANAALTFTLHFIGLLTFYLGVRLPFEVGWSGGKLGVGIPEIWATRGEDRGGWARWSVRCPLHLPLSPSTADLITNTSTVPVSSPPSPSSSPPLSTAGAPFPSQIGSSPSRTQRRDSINSSQNLPVSHPSTSASFSTALAMLSYNTAYLAQTQGVDVSLSSAASGQLLATLWAVCCSADLGVMSHATRPMLGPPASTLDFRQLLQAQAIVSGAGQAAVAAMSSPSKKERKSKKRIAIDVVAEEEDGWEVKSWKLEKLEKIDAYRQAPAPRSSAAANNLATNHSDLQAPLILPYQTLIDWRGRLYSYSTFRSENSRDSSFTVPLGIQVTIALAARFYPNLRLITNYGPIYKLLFLDSQEVMAETAARLPSTSPAFPLSTSSSSQSNALASSSLSQSATSGPSTSNSSSVTATAPTLSTPPELESTLAMLSSHRTVLGYLLLSRPSAISSSTSTSPAPESVRIIRSSGVVFEGESGKRYAGAIGRIVDAVGRGLADVAGVDGAGDTDEVRFMRIRTKRHELMISPDERYLLAVLHDPST